ncbi:MAG: universal stress protein [Chloroflexi bacterium]|nr:MAG: universal stress protein [Chloroflexota bacterium]
MKKILFPTRGGLSSRANQDRAISLAKERGARLIFFHVTDIRFLNHMASPLLIDIEKEMDELATFMLAMAQERAEKAGVEARYVVGHGIFRQALKKVIEEQEVSLILLGAPQGRTGLTTLDFLQELAQELQTDTGVEVILIKNGEIIDHFTSESGEFEHE